MNIIARISTALWALTIPLAASADLVPEVHRNIHRQMQAETEHMLAFQNFVDSIRNSKGVDESTTFDLFPALDLYGSFDDASVDPTVGKNVKIPATMDIDLRGFYPPIKGRINSPFGWRRRRPHKGIDIHLYVGDTVRAAWDGQVRIRRFDRRGYGYYYVVRHPNGLETVYGHLSKHIVQQGDVVRAGQALGLGGSTGRSTGPHLHLEFRFMGVPINPAEVLDLSTFEPRSETFHFVHSRVAASLMQPHRATTPAAAGGRVSAAVGGGSSPGYHVVRQGDTLGKIARRYGTTVARLCSLNGIKSTSTLRLGQKIRYR